MNNTALATVFIALALISVGVNTWFLTTYSARDATSNVVAHVRACINAPPIINVSGCGYATELTPYVCTARVFDSFENETHYFTDNTTLFNITNSGVMSFYPQYGSAGNYSIHLTVTDNSGCPNDFQQKTFMLHILPYPSNDTLNITDSTHNKTTYKFDPVTFTANYSDVNTNKSIKNATCSILYDYQNLTSLPMTYNATSRLYERYEYSGFLQGTYNYSVTCNGLSVGYGILTKYSNFTITDRPPYLYTPFPNLTIRAGLSVSGYDLNDYFKDNDFDTLSFTETSPYVILVKITPLGIVTITPNPSISGNYTIFFHASDGILSATSNPVHIKVLPYHPPQGSTGGGGGGGGGGGANVQTPPPCTPKWVCGDWGPCLTTGIQQRYCRDAHNCSTIQGEPPTTRACEYVGTCSDHIKNCHNGLCETGVDCGGTCAACPSCFDGIKDQNEVGVDCGGVCDPCPNATSQPSVQHPSPIGKLPEPVRKASYIGLVTLLLAIIATILASLYLHRNLFKAVARWASQLMAPPEREVSEHAQYVIAVEVLSDKRSQGASRKETIAQLAQRTSEVLAWTLGTTDELTFDEIRAKANETLPAGLAKTIARYTELLERAQYRKDEETSERKLFSGAIRLAGRLAKSDPYTAALAAAAKLPRPIKERLLSQLSDAIDVLAAHKKLSSAALILPEAKAYADGLRTKSEALRRFRALEREVSR